MRTPVSTDKPHELPKPGMRLARCVRLIDLGTHYDEKWKKDKRLILIGFELSGQVMEDGRPFMLSKRYTLSHSEKAELRKDLENWYGKQFDTKALDAAGGFDLTKLLGRPAMVNITHSDDGKYANIRSVNPAPEGMDPIPQVNPTLLFSFDNFDEKAYQALSEGVRAKVQQSAEGRALFGGAPQQPAQAAGLANAALAQIGNQVSNEGFDDDIPF